MKHSTAGPPLGTLFAVQRRSNSRKKKPVPPDSPDERSLVLAGSGNLRLTKAQRAFNQLVRRIERLQEDIVRENRRLDELVAVYASEIHPVEIEIARLRREVLRRLHARFVEIPRRNTGMKNRFRKMLEKQLLDHWAELDERLDDEFQALFQSVMKCTPEEFHRRESDEIRTEIEREFEELGMDIDLSGIEPGAPPEEIRRKLEEIEQKVGAQFESQRPLENAGASRRRQAEEEKRRLAEEIRTKDLSSLYKQLAKLLHPDLEQDPQRRSEKEAAMKQLNAAHAARDLHAMLKMEIEWITREGTDPSRLSDQKLAVYNSVLREQADELERMLPTVWMHPRFLPLSRFAHPFLGLLNMEPRDLRHDVRSTLGMLTDSLELLGGDLGLGQLEWLVRQLGPARRNNVWSGFGY